MADDCGHHHHHGVRAPRSRDAATRARERRNLFISLILAGTVMIAEFVGGLLTGSLALLSDAAHMLADFSAVGLSLLALSFAARPRDSRRTYGFYRLEILAALFNGLFLVVLAGFIFSQAIERFSNPPVIDTLPMLGWAGIGLLANAVSLYFLSQSRDSLNARGALLHVLFDGISSVFVVGGGVVMYYTGWYLLDPILSCALGVLILFSSVRLAWEATHVLLESVPKEIRIEHVEEVIGQVPDVCEVHDLHVWSITSGMSLLSAHVVVKREALGRNDAILADVNRRIRDHFSIEHCTLQIESEGYEHVERIC